MEGKVEKSLLGVSCDVKVQVGNYLKEKRREDLENLVCLTNSKVLLMVLRGPEASSAHIHREGPCALSLEAQLRARMFPAQ